MIKNSSVDYTNKKVIINNVTKDNYVNLYLPISMFSVASGVVSVSANIVSITGFTESLQIDLTPKFRSKVIEKIGSSELVNTNIGLADGEYIENFNFIISGKIKRIIVQYTGDLANNYSFNPLYSSLMQITTADIPLYSNTTSDFYNSAVDWRPYQDFTNIPLANITGTGTLTTTYDIAYNQNAYSNIQILTGQKYQVYVYVDLETDGLINPETQFSFAYRLSNFIFKTNVPAYNVTSWEVLSHYNNKYEFLITCSASLDDYFPGFMHQVSGKTAHIYAMGYKII